MKGRTALAVIGVLMIVVLCGCFVSDDNDDNPANTVSPGTVLTGNFVLSMTITGSINTNPSSSLPWYAQGVVQLTNSSGSPVAGQTIDIWADDQLNMVGFSQALGAVGVVDGFSLVTGADGRASFYVGLIADNECAFGSVAIVAQTRAEVDSDAPVIAAYDGVMLENSGPVACP